jgi:hypothetical protein
MSQNWMEDARRNLLELRGNAPAWSYRQQGAPAGEPSVLAALGVLASGCARSSQQDLALADRTATWLAMVQRPDGSVPVSERIATPGWVTPYAILLWRALPAFEAARRRACEWVIQLEGLALARGKEAGAVIGHDSSSIGWPWVDGTHSWIEPTALAIVALCREGKSAHPRVDKGIDLILDRAIKGGGWNYGNKAVFGRDLRPQPGPTGLALLALAARKDCSPQARAGIDYLRSVLPGVRAAISLGWGVLGLRAHGSCPRDAGGWLAESFERSAPSDDATMNTAILLLAASERALDYLIDRGRQSAPPLEGSASPESFVARVLF